MRTGQALFRQSQKKTKTLIRGQLYVDDPAIVAKGARGDILRDLDLLLAWWMALGIPLAWARGKLIWNQAPHEWIGVCYTPTVDGDVLMELPAKFLTEFLAQLEPFCKTKGGCPLKDAERMVGRAGRIAHIVPAARPFTTGLYAALAAEKRSAQAGRSKSHGRLVAAKRFASSACWLRALVRGDEGSVMPLRRLVRASGPRVARTSSWVIQFDASTTGGGAVLRLAGCIKEFVHVQWHDEEVRALGVTVGDSKFQSFWEFLMVLVALVVWGDQFVDEEVGLIGDSTSALQDALHLKGLSSEGSCGFTVSLSHSILKFHFLWGPVEATNSGRWPGRSVMAAVAREIAWRQQRRGWAFRVGHIPAERNTIADALSRLHDTPALPFPAAALRGASERRAPRIGDLWRTLAFPK